MSADRRAVGPDDAAGCRVKCHGTSAFGALLVAPPEALCARRSGELQASPRPTSVAYGGQSVRFICNNHCDAQNAIAYLDNYIVKNSAT